MIREIIIRVVNKTSVCKNIVKMAVNPVIPTYASINAGV